ncbi:MAG: four helix bundle protein [Candidatus Margulisbacteria bacterium]|nr:four helix bundle protein [Candidatus Margulisiibacteriota bacterium]
MNEKIKDFYDLEAWKHGHEFVVDVYRTTKEFPKHEVYGIVSQLRRAAASITSNIAEGFSRYSYKDKVRFYYNSRGSISECQNCILISRDIGYVNNDQATELLIKADKIRQILNGLIRSTEARA